LDRSLAVDEERIRPGHLLALVLCVFLSALTLMVGYQEGRLPHKKPILLIPRSFLLEHVEEEDHREPADPGSPGKMAVEWK